MGVESYKIFLDVPSRNPALGFGQTASALRDIIETSDPQFAAGIFGGWGAGKTTLIENVQDLLDKDRVITVRFNAWRYEKEDHLIVPLLDTVRDALVKWADGHPTGKKTARKTASTIGRVMRSILAGASIKVGVPGAIEVSYDANKSLTQVSRFQKEGHDAQVSRSFYHASFRALETAFADFVGEKQQHRIVVFIDDLDRCLPQGALDVLESMKLFFDWPGFVFVVGLDRAVVEWCIDTKYRKEKAGDGEAQGEYQIRGSDYIKKIFQVPFTLPPVDIRQLDEFLAAVYSEADIPAEQLEDLRTVVEPHLRFLLTDSGINPREVKRYINGYTLVIKVKPHLNRNAVLALQTISFRSDWDVVRKFLYAYREVFTDALRRQLGGEDRAVENLNPSLGSIPDSFIRYVESDAPANQLLEIKPLDEYIYSGEAVQYSQDTRLLDLIPAVANLRGLLQEISVAAGDEKAETTTTVERRLEAAKAFERQIKAILSGLSEYFSGPAAERAFRDLAAIADESRQLPELAKEREAFVMNGEVIVARTLDRLMSSLHGGDLGGKAWEAGLKSAS